MITEPWTYYITDRKSSSLSLAECLRRAVEAGVDFIQIREKDMPARDLFLLARQVRAMTLGRHTRVLINDRIDVALAAGLDGVHLGGGSVPPRILREALGRADFLVGVSTHSLQEIVVAAAQGADYVTFGPVYFTPSKAAYGSPVGLGKLQQAAQAAPLPVLALGGIGINQYAACLATGACGIAAIRLFQDPTLDLGDLVLKIKSTMQ